MSDKQEPGGRDVKEEEEARISAELRQACLSSCPQVTPEIERNQSQETRTRRKAWRINGKSIRRRTSWTRAKVRCFRLLL